MNTDTLDRAGHAAADALHAELADLDTEGALTSVLAGDVVVPATSTPALRARRWAAAAAMVAVLGVAATVLVVTGRADDAMVGTASEPTSGSAVADPTAYGSRIGRLQSAETPGLVAEVFGPQPLGAADEVAVVITGALPGQAYAVSQCLRADIGEVHPALGCSDSVTIEVDGTGSAVGVVRLRAVFAGMQPLRHNDCRVEPCDLVVTPLIGEDQPDDGLPGTRFVAADHPWPDEGSASPWLPLTFDPGAEVGPLPTMRATAVSGQPGEGHRIRIDGRDLPVGQFQLVLSAFDREPVGPLGPMGAVVYEPLAEVEVGADGSFSMELEVPDELVADALRVGVDGELLPTATISCADAPWACELRAAWAAPPPSTPAPLLPEPVPYPGS